MSKLILIDGNAILHRAYHALPKTLTDRENEPINAVYGFVSILLRLISDLEPSYIVCTFDRKEPTFRHKEFKDYQSHRPETDKELISQFSKIREVVSSFNIPIYEKAGFEADDLIGTLSVIASKGNKKYGFIGEVVIVTGDRDIFQLVSEKVKVYFPVKGLSKTKLIDEREVKKTFNINANQVQEYKALVGDPSDNYPGVPGIGPKTAVDLLKKYGSVKGIYENIEKIDKKVADKLKKGKSSAEMSLKLARIVTDVDIEFDPTKAGSWSVGNEKTLKLFEKYGFKTLTKRIKNMEKKKSEKGQMTLL